MVLSRIFAQKRISTGTRPSFLGAWGLVLADAVILALAFLLCFRPFQNVTTALELPTFMIVMALILLVFIPIQAVLITSALWAAKSRWVDTDDQR